MTDSRKKVLIGIPVFNSAVALPSLFEEIIDSKILMRADVVFIDNCSSDEGLALLQSFANLNNVRVFQNISNVGLGGSQKAIFAIAQSEHYMFVSIFHSDMQPILEDLVIAINRIELGNHDAVLGARFQRGAKRLQYPLIRFFGNIVLLILFSIRFRRIVYDLGSGLNVYKTSKLPNYSDLPNDLSFNCNLLVREFQSGSNIDWQPIVWRQGMAPSSLKPFLLLSQSLKAMLGFFVSSAQPEPPVELE
jgi:glycosyltransferase involved in cell wall biosynthesis